MGVKGVIGEHKKSGEIKLNCLRLLIGDDNKLQSTKHVNEAFMR